MEKIHNNHLLANRKPTILLTSIYIIIFFFFHNLSVPVTSYSPPVYTPETIFLDCGASGNFTSQDGPRTWTGDIESEYFPLQKSQNNASKPVDAQRQQSGVDQTPNMKARLSHTQFTYTFNLTPGQKFIRFYFHLDSYENLDKSKAVFSVKSNSFTLLSNFSTLLTAKGEPTIFKEYCVNVEQNQNLDITFTPSQDYKESYAFINGIEIVSMPPNFYYTTATGETDFPYIGQAAGSRYPLLPSNALEMLYRVNVGGNDVPSGRDTGLYRFWLKDEDYLTEARPSALPVSLNKSSGPNFSLIKNYSAPVDVYFTARTMGLDGNVNQNYRLTWQFLVDSGFTYRVRLHFCEFQSEIQKFGDRVFEIYIDGYIAEPKYADVIAWTGANGVPVYRDYAVLMAAKANQKQQNLSIALHPAPVSKTKYSDAILNGVEIFKVDNLGILAGPNPDALPTVVAPPPDSKSTKPSNSRKIIILVVVGVVSSFVVVSVLFLFICRRRITKVKEYSGPDDSTEKSRWRPFSFSTTTTKSTKSNTSSLPSDLCAHFSLSEIKAATNNFDKVFIVGVGGFGNVYKGFINGGTTPVAIKRLNPGSQQGAHEFKTEIEMLSRLRYLHLVSLIGYCNDAGEMILVYDYMSRGTLRDHLYNTDNPPLSWSQRLQICIGAARGLHYLHTGSKHVIIHRDVKTTNILLDEKWVAKVSDFGLSKVGPTSTSKAHVSTVVKGSFGYLDPEYYRLQRLTEKSDVYSFGVVLCEVLCARAPLIRTAADKKEAILAAWARQCYDQNGTLDKIVDQFLKGKIGRECLKKFSEVAMRCLEDEGTKRPSMSDVVWGLEFALQLQEEDDKLGGGICEPHLDDDCGERALIKSYASDYDSGMVFSRIGGHVLESRTISTVTTSTSDDYGFSSKDSDSRPIV